MSSCANGLLLIGALWLPLCAFAQEPAASPGTAVPQPPVHVEMVLLNDFAAEEIDPATALSREGEHRAEALAHFAQGLAAEDLAETDQATEYFLRVIELDPGQSDLAIKVAFDFVRAGDIARGIGILKDAMKASPREPLLLLNLASIYARNLRKFDLAIRYAREAVEIAPSDPLVYQTLHEIYLAAGQISNAEKILERAARLESTDAEFWMRLGDLYTRTLVKEGGELTPQNRGKIDRVFAKALQFGPGDPLVLNRVADFYVASDRIPEALALYVKILENQSGVSAPLLVNVREKLARGLLAGGKRDEAITVLEEMVRDNPLQYESYELLGQLYQEKGDFEKALGVCEQSLLLSPNQPANYLRVSDLCMRLHRSDRAVKTLEDARARFRDIPLVTYSLAIAYQQAGRYDEALQAFEETQQEAGVSQEEILNGQFYFNYGAAAEQAGLPEKAVALMKKSIEIDPANAAQALNFLAYFWIDKGIRLDEAGAFLDRALEMEPDNGAFIDSLGWLHYRRGHYDKALGELLRAAGLLEEPDAVVFDHIADTYLKLGNTAQAVVYWEKSLGLNPDDKKIGAKRDAAKQQVTENHKP